MTVTIELSPDEEHRLRERAEQLGQDPGSYVRRLIRQDLEAPGSETPRTFAEVLAPVHEEIKRAGMTEQEVDTLLEEALGESRAERRSKKNSPR